MPPEPSDDHAAPTGDYDPQPDIDPFAGSSATPDSSFGDRVGEHIGPFKLLQLLGEGGMGVVYVAEQSEPVRRRVALKIIKPGVATAHVLARFEQERQALALMDHPNIAKVLDAGESPPVAPGGLPSPYIVMELVKGVPITKFCDDAKLTPRQRLELFIPVCQAIQHAHQKGIIHRDLKPSNVLIAIYDGKPVPKVIDFGVAKATGPRLTEHTVFTDIGNIIGTLEYMAPEQAELNNLDIDTRADIYSLGVLLYELLTGSVPFSRKELQAAGLGEMIRVIQQVEPTKPSTKISSSHSLPAIAAVRQMEPAKLTKLVRGELDWITMKALEKERSRRYETANALAMEIQRYLNDEPVLAGPPSRYYRFSKFVRRNKTTVIGGTITFLLALLTIASVVRTQLVERDRRIKEYDAALNLSSKESSAKSWEATSKWEYIYGSYRMINDWFSDEGFDAKKLDELNVLQIPVDRKRLRHAMKHAVLTMMEKNGLQIEQRPELTLALMKESAYRDLAVRICSELDRPAQAIPFLKRQIAIRDYLRSPESGLLRKSGHELQGTGKEWFNALSSRDKALHDVFVIRDDMLAYCPAEVILLDFRERVGEDIESLDQDIANLCRYLATLKTEFLGFRTEFANERRALEGVRGALLSRRAQHFDGEKLLLARYDELSKVESPDYEVLPNERLATVRRLIDLYARWNRPEAVNKWQLELERLNQPIRQAEAKSDSESESTRP